MHAVDEADMADDLTPLIERHDGQAPLGPEGHLIRDDPGDEDVAARLGGPQDVEVADVEQVVDARRVADANGRRHGRRPW